VCARVIALTVTSRVGVLGWRYDRNDQSDDDGQNNDESRRHYCQGHNGQGWRDDSEGAHTGWRDDSEGAHSAVHAAWHGSRTEANARTDADRRSVGDRHHSAQADTAAVSVRVECVGCVGAVQCRVRHGRQDATARHHVAGRRHWRTVRRFDW
jgi:hypothetical protein